jgi:hypothetical protein
LTHDIVGDEGGLYSLHIEVQGLEYGIVHILLAFGRSIHQGHANGNEHLRLSLLKVNNGIRHKGPMNACRGTNSS